MKAVIVFGRRDARVVDLEIPKIGEGEILVKMKACGICGTDVEKYEGDFITPPILGHEVSGIIEESRKEGLKVGSKVFVHHHVPCRKCYYCLRGDFTMCEEFKKVNFDPCGLAEFFRVPKKIVDLDGVFLLKDTMDFEEATFIEPLACCIRALEKVKPCIGDKVAVLGSGPSGLLHLILLKKAIGAEVAMIDINERRLEFAYSLGCDIALNPMKEGFEDRIFEWSKGRGADLVILATGNTAAFNQSIKILRRGGKLLVFGSPKKGSSIILPFDHIFINEIKIFTSYSTTELEIQRAISLIESGIPELKKMITHRFQLIDAIKALEIASKGEAIKAIVYS